MAAPSTALITAMAFLTADAIIELGYITSMVAYLHGGAPSGTFIVNTPATLVANAAAAATYEIKGKPQHMLVNQGHTSNGAAGSAIVLIGIVGAIALLARARLPGRRLTRFVYSFWMILQIPALLLTLSALGYTFAVTNRHRHQTIDQTIAYNTQPGPYAVDQWTPQNWFAAVLSQLDLRDADLVNNLSKHLRIMRGWQYNLIPMFLLQLLETVLAIVDWWVWQKNGGHSGPAGCVRRAQDWPMGDEKGAHQGDYHDQPQYENNGYANQHQGYTNGNGNGSVNGQQQYV
jgi:hypothetical protein